MSLSVVYIGSSFFAGLISVLSPCILPILPGLISGSAEKRKHRALFITIGLSVTFIVLGILSTLFGQILGGYLRYIEMFGALIILLVGILILFKINIFNSLHFFTPKNIDSFGYIGDLLLGMSLGLIWVPCIGPVLSGILSLVATSGKLLEGIVLLAVYSIGFSIPILLAGYFFQYFRKYVSNVYKYPNLVRYVSGVLMIGLSVYILA